MDSEKAQKIIADVFNHLSIPVESVVYSFNEKRGHVFSIKSAEFEKVSLEKPDLTKDFVYLLKRIFNKDSKFGEELFKCTIDINDMQSKADDKVRIKALNAAEEARNLKADVTFNEASQGG